MSGGWFDCGDHVMFGQTQYWAAYTLAKAYEMFPKGFYDLYSPDYSGYKSSGKWNDMDGGTPNGIPDIIDELVYETDYIAKAAVDASNFVTIKGDGNYDHQRWVTAPMMSRLPVSLGGECKTGGTEKYELNSSGTYTFQGHTEACTEWTSRQVLADNDKSMASYGAATLAIMTRILKTLGIYPDRQTLYAERAKYAYSVAQSSSKSISYGSFYGANANQSDDYVTASVEMYKTFGDTAYFQAAFNNKSGVNANHNWGFNYNNNDDIAYYNLAESNIYKSAIANLKTYANYYKNKVDANGVSEVGDASWGTNRYPVAGAFVMAAYSQLAGVTDYDSYIYSNIDYVMGNNSAKQSFITGFRPAADSASYKTPQHPHHRGYYQNNTNPDDAAKASMTVPVKNQSHGALVGNVGYSASSYQDNVISYTYTEVCTDYNVGLVGALGYIVSELAPSSTSGISSAAHQSTVFNVMYHSGRISVTLAGDRPVSGEAYDVNGHKVASLDADGQTLSLSTTGLAHGVYVLRVRTAMGQSAAQNVMVY